MRRRKPIVPLPIPRVAGEPFTWRSLDLVSELAALWQHALAAGYVEVKRPPHLTVRCSAKRSYTTGRMWTSHRIVLTIGTAATIGDVLGVLAHEVAHFRGLKALPHNETFWGALAELARRRWGLPPESWLTTARAPKIDRQCQMDRALDLHLAARAAQTHIEPRH